MIRSIISALLLLFVFSLATAQPYNTVTYSTKIYDFKADSLKFTAPFPLGDNEGLRATIYANDTSAVGYVSDSIVAYWGLQYGDITTNYLEQKDTMWVEPSKVTDTFRMATANIKAANTWTTVDTLDPLAICTTHVSGYAYQSRIIQPYRFPIARVKIKGATGNELTSFLRLRIDISQPKYTRVDAGQTKQPDDNGTR